MWSVERVGDRVEDARVAADHSGPEGRHQNFELYSEGFGKPLENLGQRRGMI